MFRIECTGYSIPATLASQVDGDTIDGLSYLYRNTRFEDFIHRIEKEARILFVQDYICYTDYPEYHNDPMLKKNLDGLGIEYRLEEFDDRSQNAKN